MNLKSKMLLDYYGGGLLHCFLKPFVVALGNVLHRDHDLGKCSTVTILKLLGGGSLVIAYPSLLALKGAPGVERLRLVTSPAVKPFAEILGVFDEIVVIDDRSISGLIQGTVRAIAKLFRTDAIVDLEVHSRLTTVFCLFTCARNRVGFYTHDSFWRKGLSTHLLFLNVGRGIYHYYDQLATLFGGTLPSFDQCVERFGGRERGAAQSAETTHFGIAPCCSDLGKERMLTTEEWVRILDRELPATGRVELHGLGAKADRAFLEELRSRLQARRANVDLVIHAGELSLADSVKALGAVEKLFCIDSGLLHFARLIGTPTQSYWGPSDPQTRLRPAERSADQAVYAQLPCSPCVHLSATAPCGGENVCMRAAACGAQDKPNPVWLAYPMPEGKTPVPLPTLPVIGGAVPTGRVNADG